MREETLKEWIEVAMILCLPALLSFSLWLLTLRTGPIYISPPWIVFHPEIFKWATIFWVTGGVLSIILSYFEPQLERIFSPLEEKVRGKEIYIMLGLFAFLTFFGLTICFKVEEVAYGVVYTWEDYLKILIIAISLASLITIAHIVNEKLKRKKRGEKR